MNKINKNNIDNFNFLLDAVFFNTINLKNVDICLLVSIIYKYVESLENTKNYKFKNIAAAPILKSKKVYDFIPGTGQSEKQFYKYARAIYEGRVDCSNITSEKLLLILRSYYFDMIE